MERYFVSTLHQICEVTQLIETEQIKTNVFQVVVLESEHIKKLTWCLLKKDISFERKPLGSGITNFFIDTTLPFFMKTKPKQK